MRILEYMSKSVRQLLSIGAPCILSCNLQCALSVFSKVLVDNCCERFATVSIAVCTIESDHFQEHVAHKLFVNYLCVLTYNKQSSHGNMSTQMILFSSAYVSKVCPCCFGFCCVVGALLRACITVLAGNTTL